MREKLQLLNDGRVLRSTENSAEYHVGSFACPSLKELRDKAGAADNLLTAGPPTKLEHIATTDVFQMHADPAYAKATFMAASQFNCLEFPSPEVTPEDGVTNYVHDPTQGPACALAAAPATVYRNYFAPVGGQLGQTAQRQLNNLDEVLQALGPLEDGRPLVSVSNGYTFSDDDRLRVLNERLEQRDQREREALLEKLRIGLHSDVEVPWSKRFQLLPPERRSRVSQTFCSALSCGYSDGSLQNWEPLARLVLDASYEATLLAAAIARQSGLGNGVVVLTLLGGGVFGNRNEWIEAAIARAVKRCSMMGLRVVLAHFGRVDKGRVSRLEELIATE